MRIVVVTFGSEGHVRPLVALSQGLADAGHEVVLLADAQAASTAREAGVAFEPLGGEDLSSKAAKALAWHRRIDEFGAGTDVFIGASDPAWVTVSVADQHHAVPMIASLHPVEPSIVLPHPWAPRFDLPGPVVRHVGRLAAGARWRAARDPLMDARARLGLPTFPRPWEDVTFLLGYSPTVVPRPHDWDDLQVVTGDWPLIRPQEPLPADLAAFLDDGEPPAYVGFGHLHVLERRRVREAVLQGLAGRRVVIAGPGASEFADDLPASTFAIEHVEHDALFPRCSVVVHHAGPGTVHSAVRWGVPSVTVPMEADQPFWAWRLHHLGAAAPPVPRHRLSARAIAEAVDLATESSIRHDVERLATQLRREHGIANAVAAVEAGVA